MRMQLKSFSFRTLSLFLLTAVAVSSFNSSEPAYGSTWNNLSGGDFSTPGNWTGGVPNSVGAIADFSTLNINSDVSVTLNSPVTLGTLSFGDTHTSTGGSWELRTDNAATAIITLDNGGTKPTINVNPLVPATTFDDAFVGHNLAGTMGFTKTGGGILTLGQGATHTITGGIDINAGTLRAQSPLPGNVVTIGNGATLETNANFDGGGAGLAAPSGATANLRLTGSNSISNVAPAGATMNVHFAAATAPTLTFNADWAVGGTAAAYNFTSANGGFLRLRPNGGNFNTETAFAGAVVTMDNVGMWLRSNSQGNTINMGSLSGTSTATLYGGGQGGGTAARYVIGALNTNTEFAGTLDGVTDHGVGSIASLDIIKVGTGTLTFSGNLTNFVPSAFGSGGTSPWRRGGNLQVQAGTVRFVGTTAMPGGTAGSTAGDLQSHIEVAAGASLDVSGYTAGTYTTPQLQSIIGSGTIVGNWNHANGVIEAGNTMRALGGTDANASTNNVAGTLTFNGNLSLSGGGIGYDMSLDSNSGNDLINVTGSVNITGGKIVPNFIGGSPPTSGTYVVLTAAGGITGSAASIVVDYPGRSADGAPTISGNSLVISAGGVTPAKALTWVGNGGSTWDEEATTNWTDGSIAEKFFQFDTVSFDDTATSKTVTINGVVRPGGTVTVNTNTGYTFAGTGQIVGTVGFTKTGSGNLAFQQGNLFAGPASVTGGTLDIAGNGNALGTGALTLDNVNVVATTGFTNPSLSVANGVNISVSGNADSGGAYNLPQQAGSGTVNMTTDIVNKWVAIGSNAGFTGTMNVGTPGQAGTFTNLRMTSAGTNFAGGNWSGTVFNIAGPTILTNRQGGDVNVIQQIQIGEIHAADPASGMTSFLGGSTAVPTNWVIGALNTNSDFAGVMADGGGSNNSTSQMHLTKVGTGTLTLTGANTYTGNTTINGGVLSINNPYLADTADVLIGASGVFNLNFGGTDTIDSLYLGGTPQNPGTYGSLASSATFKSAFFTGAGILSVTTLGLPITTPGDFDGDGDVDGRDFLVWQRGQSPNPLSAGDLATWQTNYGMGSLVAQSSAVSVPEPAGVVLALACGFAALALRKRG